MTLRNNQDKPISSLAVVLPRFGKELGGGAETLVRAIIERISPECGNDFPPLSRLEVWTTCAVDHRTWDNVLAPGKTVEDGITVWRFEVDSRDLELFIHYELAMREDRVLGPDEQLHWLQNSVNSSGLYRHIAAHGKEFDAILFAPYLFATSFWGALIYPSRSVVVPCLHNEHYAYQGVFRVLFSRVRGLIFNSEPERQLARELYNIAGFDEKSAVVGMGFDSKDLELGHEDTIAVRKPFLLYSGRKEAGKNLDLLIDCFEQYQRAYKEHGLQLVIIGAGELSFRERLPENVFDLGFVSSQAKYVLMKNALALCQPSVNESFSIVMMEAWLHETPVVVHADCAVTREHVIQSGGGLYFANPVEFFAVVNELINNENLCRKLALAGKRYVEDNYSWPVVIERFYRAFEKFGFTEDGDEQRVAGASFVSQAY